MPPKKGSKKAAGGAAAVVYPRTQRKIYHLLSHSGQGDTFTYYDSLNADTGFAEGDEVILTEKWDGTTCQATSKNIFKRVDSFKPGDPAKHSASEEERYRLEVLDLDSPGNKYINLAVTPYLERFASMEDGLCVFFEVVGTHINARFQHLPDWYDIRVFDFSKGSDFLPFEETISLAETYDLPLVHYEETRLHVSSLIHQLTTGREYDDIAAPLEGFVIRDADGARIAKFRCEDVPKITAK